jgi:hypothetical protein
MASTIKVDKIEGSTGTTVTVPTGQTFTVTDGMAVAGGGTGLTSFTTGDVLYASGTTTLTKLAKGTAEQILSMNAGETAPEWATAAPTAGGTGQTTWAVGDLLYANGVNTLTKLTKPGSTMNLQMTSAGVPSWVAPPGGGMAFLATVSASSSASVSLDGYFTSDYDTYLINYTNVVPVTDAQEMGFRVRVSDADVSTGVYYGCESGMRRSSGANTALNAGGWAQTTAHFTWNETSSNTTTYSTQGQLRIYNPLDTTAFKTYDWTHCHSSSGGSPTYWMQFCGAGYAATASALTGLSFSFAGFGSSILTGKFDLYGYKNS